MKKVLLLLFVPLLLSACTGKKDDPVPEKPETPVTPSGGEEEGNVLLLSRRILDVKKYNETHISVTWETCSLRTWLNDRVKWDVVSVDDQTSDNGNGGSGHGSGYCTPLPLFCVYIAVGLVAANE